MPSTTQVQELELQINAPVSPAYAEILTPGSAALRRQPAAQVRRAAAGAAGPQASAPGRDRRRPFPDFLTETDEIRLERMDSGSDSARSDGSPRRDHRAGGSQDGDQRAQLAARTFSWRISKTPIRPRGATISTGKSICATRTGARSSSPVRRARSTSSMTKIATLLVRPRGWHLNEKHVLHEREADFRLVVRFRFVFFPQRQAVDREWVGSVLLFAEAGEPSGSAPVERCLQFRAGRAGNSARDHPRHGADRNHSGFVRDGRDFV